MYALQHRGQESAGIATSDGSGGLCSTKGWGWCRRSSTKTTSRPLKGHLAIGHNRYSTTGSSHLRNAQPYLIETIYGPLGVAHNGNLTNALELRQMLLERGVGLVVHQRQRSDHPDAGRAAGRLERRIPAPIGGRGGFAHLMQLAEGAYSLRPAHRATPSTPCAIRMGCARCAWANWRAATSSPRNRARCRTIGATFVREVEPGEIVRLDRRGITSAVGVPPAQRALCVFEYVYFARPDS